MNGLCAVNGCEQIGRLINGVCGMHNYRMKTWGFYGPAESIRPRGRICDVDGCQEKRHSRGLCREHYSRWSRYGDPLGRPSARPRRSCTFGGCSARHWARGYCRKHYRRWHANGTPEPRGPEDRFWAQVEKRGPDECWLWVGATLKGYGRGNWNGEHYYAHRKSWELANGPIPDGLYILHACDNPPCVNPAHLRPGTQAENVRDMVERGRGHWHRRVAS